MTTLSQTLASHIGKDTPEPVELEGSVPGSRVVFQVVVYILMRCVVCMCVRSVLLLVSIGCLGVVFKV